MFILGRTFTKFPKRGVSGTCTPWNIFVWGRGLQDNIIDIIGKENFEWLSEGFGPKTTLRDIPDDILDRVSSLDITLSDYGGDRNAITAIALITFTYMMAGKAQRPQDGPSDLRLMKVLARNEKQRRERREGTSRSDHRAWDLPVCELITGEVGERIRATGVVRPKD